MDRIVSYQEHSSHGRKAVLVLQNRSTGRGGISWLTSAPGTCIIAIVFLDPGRLVRVWSGWGCFVCVLEET
jgi:hypothetical protein